MKSIFYKTLLLVGMLAANADAISLYDTAPAVGLPESHAVKYSASVRLGYDSNRNASPDDEDASLYVNGAVGASFADFESVDKITYNLRLGATRYLSEVEAGGQEMFADCSLSASFVHAFSSRSTYSASLNLQYSPEPDYASGISAARRQGDCLNWSFSNSYNQSIDSRWSWNVSAGYSGNIYGEEEYQNDDRQYLSCSAGMSYRASELLSYNSNLSFRYDLREMGYDSENVTWTVGFRRSLDPVSSCSGSMGLQAKKVHNDTIFTPNFNFGYNRQVADGLSVNTYLTLSNENVDTYRGVGANYLSDVTWRLGVNCSYRLSPDVSFTFGVSLLRSTYSEGTGRLPDETNTTITPSIGMSYRFTDKLTGSINYQYTWHDTDRQGGEGYTRHNISTGLQYSF